MKQKRKTKIGLKNKEHQPTTEPNLFFGIFVVIFFTKILFLFCKITELMNNCFFHHE